MKTLFDSVALNCSKLVTRSYSTSFSLGIYFLDKRFHNPIYGIYGFVRFADEIVDTFHGYNKAQLLEQFKKDTYQAIETGISLNPILHSFQLVVNKYNIDRELIETFLKSMEMDLNLKECTRETYEEYILGSAEVVGLMCLKVFVEGDINQYNNLKQSAMYLGAAFQKVNFLRDLRADFQLGRTYFPSLNVEIFSLDEKVKIEKEIEEDFSRALIGIKQLPKGARKGVYLAYVYYRELFRKLKNVRKFYLMVDSIVRYKLNLYND
jgi:phytoene synthase